MINQLLSILSFISPYYLYFFRIWVNFKLLNTNLLFIIVLINTKQLIYCPIRLTNIIYFLYTINLYFLYYLDYKNNIFNILFFKKKFIFYWCYIFNFYFFKKTVQIWFTNIFYYKYLFKFFNIQIINFFNIQIINFLWYRLLIMNSCKFYFKKKWKKLIKLVYNKFISYYFLYYIQIFYYYYYFKSNIINNRLIFTFNGKRIYNNWLFVNNIINFFFIKSYVFIFFYKYNNFLFYKWCYLLIFFKINNSLLTLVLPLRTQIIMFYKKYILLPYFATAGFLESIFIYNRFIFFTIYDKLINWNAQVNTVWIAVLIPKSYYLARIQFYYYHHKIYTYQKQITKFILHYYKLTIFELFKSHEFIIKNIILRSQLCFLNTFIELFFKQNFIFLNFYCLTSLYLIIYPFDIISFVVSNIFFLFYQWQVLYVDLKFNRFLYYSKFWIIRSRRMFPKQNSFRLPHWVIFYRFLFFEIPVYLEVDFFVLSIILLNYYYYSLLFYYFFSFKETSFAVIRNYNWKLLN